MNETDKAALEPCPFCGSNRITVWNIRDGQQAVCKDCRATAGPALNGPTSAVQRARNQWNRRSSPPEVEGGVYITGWMTDQANAGARVDPATGAVTRPPEVEAFQARVSPWMDACFGPEISGMMVSEPDVPISDLLRAEAEECQRSSVGNGAYNDAFYVASIVLQRLAVQAERMERARRDR